MAKKKDIKKVEFTDNEIKAMQLTIKGLTSIQVAEKLSTKKHPVSKKLAESYLYDARVKAGAKGTVNLAVMMVEAEIISLKKK